MEYSRYAPCDSETQTQIVSEYEQQQQASEAASSASGGKKKKK